MILECLVVGSLMSANNCQDEISITPLQDKLQEIKDEQEAERKKIIEEQKRIREQKKKEKQEKERKEKLARERAEREKQKREREERLRQERIAEQKRKEEQRKKKTYSPPKQSSQANTSGTHMKMEVTGYTAGYESTQKQAGEEGYGVTASGATVQQGVTVAAGSNIPFGTQLYIPYFEGKSGFGDGIFTVQDRGGAIGPNNIDVYYQSVSAAQEFGRKTLDVYIIGG